MGAKEEEDAGEKNKRKRKKRKEEKIQKKLEKNAEKFQKIGGENLENNFGLEELGAASIWAFSIFLLQVNRGS